MAEQQLRFMDIEQERARSIDEFIIADGPQWAEKHVPGSFGCHELLDRTSVAAALVDTYILNHPACVQNAEWFALAERASSALNELYQRIGSLYL